jgi:hypothetical protein
METKNYKCSFSTSIAGQLTCSKDGNFDEYGFPINKCLLFPCEKLKKIYQTIKKNNICLIKQ